MKRRFIIPEDKLNKLLSVLMNEQVGDNNAKPAREAQFKIVTTTINADSLFPTGKSDVNTQSPEFKKIVSAISKSATEAKDITTSGTISVRVKGGASAVGGPGFNNNALADKRATNMITALKNSVGAILTQAGLDVNSIVKFEKLQSVVGKATVKDSPEAKAEQFVKVTYPTRELGATTPTTAIDKTATSNSDRQLMDLRTKGLKTLDMVNMTREVDGKIVPMSQDTFDKINNVLKQWNIRLTDKHLSRPSV